MVSSLPKHSGSDLCLGVSNVVPETSSRKSAINIRFTDLLCMVGIDRNCDRNCGAEKRHGRRMVVATGSGVLGYGSVLESVEV